jgi:hypothetical protein
MRMTVLAAFAVLAACGRPADATYPPQYELNFMRACLAQAPPQGMCPCIWDKIESDVAPADFAAFDRLSPAEQQSHPLQQQIERYALDCAADLAHRGAPSSAP